ncbi:hypothetical protein L6452_31682 [Arctium lappa]|uniref:Uncharacterized protein n=1 Tax=Arctium lappa TaxID=4217 RepID=A0ACB8Z2C7_ARCLA|nr:hypothetical protein L6452_31682 [Arctium lappa]
MQNFFWLNTNRDFTKQKPKLLAAERESVGQAIGEKRSISASRRFSDTHLPLPMHVTFKSLSSIFRARSIMGGGRVAHPVLKGPSVVKELVIGAVLGLAAGGLWKMHHWNEQRKTRAFYDLLEKGEISVVVEEE